MKRNHILCIGLMMWGAGFLCINAFAAPTVATCKTVFESPSQCTKYSIDTASASDSITLYLCTCEICSDGYHLGSTTEYKNANGYYMLRTNTCVADSAPGGSGSGDSSTSRPKTCSTGSLCTMCKGPSVTINGQLYCGMWADTNGTKSCTSAPGTVNAYAMSPCCNTDGKAVGYMTGCYVNACKSGMVAADNNLSCVCDIGYYGTTTSGCARCPASGGMYGLTKEKGKSLITDCYFPTGYGIKDSTGSYLFTSDCFYMQ